MKLAFFSKYGELTGLAHRCKIENNESTLLVADERYWNMGNNLVEKSSTLTDLAKFNPDLVAFDYPGYATEAGRISKLGLKTLQTQDIIDRLCLDANLGRSTAKNVGIKVNDGKRGANITTWVWFYEGKPVYPAVSSICATKFLAGNIGQNTECQTSLLFYHSTKQPKFVQEQKKAWLILEKAKYTGPWGMNFTLAGKDVYFNRWYNGIRPWFVYPFLQNIDNKSSYWLVDFVYGRVPSIKPKERFSYAVTVSVPPYPNKAVELIKGIAGQEFSYPHIHINNLWFNDAGMKNGNGVINGVTGNVLTATMTGDSIDTIGVEIKGMLNQLQIKDIQYRVDGLNLARNAYQYIEKNKLI